jgi:hypothetical protein
MRTLLSALTVAVLSAGLLASQDEERKIPKDSVEVVVAGCLKGRFLSTTRTPRIVDGGDLEARVDRFQITGKKAVLDDLKERDGDEVEIVGFVRKRDLKEPGIRVPGGRIVISGGRGGDRYPPPPTGPPQRVVPIDVRSVRALDGPCER